MLATFSRHWVVCIIRVLRFVVRFAVLTAACNATAMHSALPANVYGTRSQLDQKGRDKMTDVKLSVGVAIIWSLLLSHSPRCVLRLSDGRTAEQSCFFLRRHFVAVHLRAVGLRQSGVWPTHCVYSIPCYWTKDQFSDFFSLCEILLASFTRSGSNHCFRCRLIDRRMLVAEACKSSPRRCWWWDDWNKKRRCR